MFVIRPIQVKDSAALESLAMEARLGITSLPKNRTLLEMKIKDSIDSFSQKIINPQNEKYLFVLEDTTTQEIGGVSGIYSKSGVQEPQYFFKQEKETIKDPSKLPLLQEIRLLRSIVRSQGPTEIGSLFLSRGMRKGGMGRLLSLSRFLFIACFPERFENLIFADMRGYLDDHNQSPFWNGIGGKFLHVDYKKLTEIRNEGHSFVPSILPKYPLYIDLLPKEVQESIGRLHPNTKPAYEMLSKEGFLLSPLINFFDGGPILESPKKEIRTIKTSERQVLTHIQDLESEAPFHLICNTQLDFRACLGTVKINGGAQISQRAASVLNVDVGSSIRYAPLTEKKA